MKYRQKERRFNTIFKTCLALHNIMRFPDIASSLMPQKFDSKYKDSMLDFELTEEELEIETIFEVGTHYNIL